MKHRDNDTLTQMGIPGTGVLAGRHKNHNRCGDCGAEDEYTVFWLDSHECEFSGTISVIRIYFLHDEYTEYTKTTSEDFEPDTLAEALRIFEREGVTFAASGNFDWAADPDGSRIVDYATGERVETTVHLGRDVPGTLSYTIASIVG